MSARRAPRVAPRPSIVPSRRRLLDPDGAEAAAEKRKAWMRAKVEHPNPGRRPDSRDLRPFPRYYNTVESDLGQRQEWQIVQS